MIIPAKSQFNWLSGFWQEDFFKFQPMRTHYGPWQPCWISNQHQKHKSGREPSSEHFWQAWLISVQRFQRRRFKCEKLTDGRTTDAYPWQKLTWPMARWAKKPKKDLPREWAIIETFPPLGMKYGFLQQNNSNSRFICVCKLWVIWK